MMGYNKYNNDIRNKRDDIDVTFILVAIIVLLLTILAAMHILINIWV